MKHYDDRIDQEFYRHLPRAEPLLIERELLTLPILMICFIILVAAMFLISVTDFAYYKAQAAENRIATITLSPPRGDILDRNGNKLAVNHRVFDCYFITSDDPESDVESISALGRFLELSTDEIERITENRRNFALTRSMESELYAAARGDFGARSILIKRDLNQVEVTEIMERAVEFPRAYVEQAYRRSYPAGESAAQIIGYMGEISENELDVWQPLGYRMGDIVGKAGLERQYDNMLRGYSGVKLVSVDARGRILGEADSVPAVVPDGGVIVVKGDEVAILKVNDAQEFSGGYVVTFRDGVLEGTDISKQGTGSINPDSAMVFPRNPASGQYGEWNIFKRPGEVALVNGNVVMRPSIIPPDGGAALRTTIDSDMQRELDQILSDTVGGILAMDPRSGAILACVSEPGFDPNLFARGGVDREGWRSILEDEHHPLLNRPVQNAYVPGSTFKIITALAALHEGIVTRNTTWLCEGKIEVGNRTFRCWNRGGHGRVDFIDAIAESCDVAFWEMAQDLGYEKIAEMAHACGLGDHTGIDIPGERGGLIPSDEWKRGRFGDQERWFTGDTMNMGIGQGFVQLTIVQEAVMTSVVANGGYLVTPHFNRLLNPAQEVLRHIDVSNDDISMIGLGMRECVRWGTGKSNNMDWLHIAGKTGTADDPPREDPHSWFVSYAPYEDPVMVLIVFAENGGHGDEKAAPMAARIWQCESVKNYLEEMGVEVPE
ncbi:MAG TPA: penicillin-binding protein 2 [bacterium]|jgi:cell division protein FtsI/penicillin-binding protein 2